MALVQVLGRRRAVRGSGSAALLTGAVLLVLLLAASFAAGALTGHDPALTDLTARFRPPTAEHWFGTDQLGRDVFTRVLVAAGTDLPLALLGAAVPAVIGIVLGALAGYARGRLGTAVMRLADLIQAFPSYILLIVLVFLLGPGAGSFLVGAAVGAWVTYARLVRGVVLRLRELDYVRAAQAAGLGHTRVLLRHVLPNALPQAVVYAASDIVLALSYLAALSYLGLGIQAPGIEWGQMIAEGQPFLRNQWWVSVMPGLAIILVGVAVRLIAGGLERRLQR
ncbi:ABC transporter permease [Herbidospora cretacea]|uniref:ABC transporter permease n=1 Tax=Herbidospora cretacea TaxID=28444 RepID=UPI0004C45FE5|nr:ABC transporter permease [Herbidospora cretacea]